MICLRWSKAPPGVDVLRRCVAIGVGEGQIIRRRAQKAYRSNTAANVLQKRCRCLGSLTGRAGGQVIDVYLGRGTIGIGSMAVWADIRLKKYSKICFKR